MWFWSLQVLACWVLKKIGFFYFLFFIIEVYTINCFRKSKLKSITNKSGFIFDLCKFWHVGSIKKVGSFLIIDIDVWFSLFFKFGFFCLPLLLLHLCFGGQSVCDIVMIWLALGYLWWGIKKWNLYINWISQDIRMAEHSSLYVSWIKPYFHELDDLHLLWIRCQLLWF